MRRWMKIGAAAVGGVAAGGAVAAAVGGARWSRETARAVGRLGEPGAAPDDGAPRTYSRDQLSGLPEPVVRYFDYSLTPGQPLIRRARLEHAGDFALRPGAWAPFTSVQHVAVRPPGFVWDAAIRMAPGVPGLAVRVRDGYAGGVGSIHAAAAAVVPVADQRGTPELAAGSLMRYLAEAPWFPTALLPSEGVAWTAVDDGTARATLADRGITVSVDFHFGARGEIVGLSAVRHRDVNGRGVLTPWAAESRRYERVQGMMVPTEGEVAWLLPEGRFPYWRARMVRAAYEFAPQPEPELPPGSSAPVSRGAPRRAR